MIADVTGYTLDFNLYIGKATESSGNGLGFDVVMELIHQYAFQGYELFTDNFYISPILLTELLQYGIVSTGTLNVTRKHIPTEVVTMKRIAEKRKQISLIVFGMTLKLYYLLQLHYAGHSESSVNSFWKITTIGS